MGAQNLATFPNPGGRPKEKAFRDALRTEIASLSAEGDSRGLRRIARALIEQAEAGKIDAIREIADRLDGKVPQAVVGDDEHDPLTLRTIITGVLRHGESEEERPAVEGPRATGIEE